MIDIHALLVVAGIFAIGVMSPGPNFMVIAQRAVAYGRAEALAAMLGVVIVSGVWASSALFGISIVFRLFPWTHIVLKVAGGCYLIWAGVRLWRRAAVPFSATPVAPGTRQGLWRAFRAGLATNLSNAKAMAFYTSAFSAAAPSADKVATLWVALSIVVLIALIWYGLVAVALSTGAVARAYRRSKLSIERTCGVLMILFGVRLATTE